MVGENPIENSNTLSLSKEDNISVTKKQVKLYMVLKNDFFQLALYGCSIFLFIFMASTYNYSLQAWEELPDVSELQLAMDSLPKGKDLQHLKKADVALKVSNFEKALQNFQTREVSSKLMLQNLWSIFWGSFVYFLIVGIPVFFVYYFVYKRRLDWLLRLVWTDTQIIGWEFPLFLSASTLISLIFTVIFAYIPIPIKQEWLLLLVSSNKYINFATIQLICLLTIGAASTKETIEKNRELERSKRMNDIRRRRTVEDALQLIRMRIRPHFLFNALQNLKILAQQKSDKLPYLMNQLSHLLRYTFTEADNKTVTIGKEIEFITSYLALEKLNLSVDTSLSFDKEIALDTEQKQIPPMLLLVIVENCFKHYNKISRAEKIIDINILTTPNYLILETKNTFELGSINEHTSTDRKHFGLKWVEEHLIILYPNQYVLNYYTQDNLFLVQLKIPLL